MIVVKDRFEKGLKWHWELSWFGPKTEFWEDIDTINIRYHDEEQILIDGNLGRK